MAIYHLNLSHGSRSGGQSAGAKLDYISREGKYAQQEDVCRLVESANLPSWANSAREFWRAADQNERANARLFSQLEFALPAELTPEGQLQLVREFAADRLPKHPYTFAIHEGKGTNPHVHLNYSERIEDSVKRTAETFFKRANKKTPERSGAAKNRELKSKEWLCETREKWADDANKALRNEASIWRKIQKTIPQIDHRTLEAQGIDREPRVHRGPERQGRIIRQYEEVIHGVEREDSRRRERKKVVNEQPRSLNQSEVERRAHQDIERNKLLKESNPQPGEREQEAFERSVNNELRMEQAGGEIEWSIRESGELLETSLQQIGRSLEERERSEEDHKQELQSYGKTLKRALENDLGRSQQETTRSLRAVQLRPGRTRQHYQRSFGRPEHVERQIEARQRHVRRHYPRVGECNRRINLTVQQRFNGLGKEIQRGFQRVKHEIRQLTDAFERRVAVAAKSLERHTSVLTNLARDIGDKMKFHNKTRRRRKRPAHEVRSSSYFLDTERLESRLIDKLHEDPPGYKCPFQEKKRIEERRKQQEVAQDKPKSKFANIRFKPQIKKSKDRGDDHGMSM